MQDRLRRIEDRLEIAEVLARYCEGLDRLDRKQLTACFHPDSQHNHGFVGPTAQFFDFAWDVLEACVATHHQIGDIQIALDGDVARVKCYFTAYHRIADPAPAFFDPSYAGKDLFIAGRYLDRFERRDGVWRIAARTGVHDWQRLEAAADAGFFDLPADQRGRRDMSDPAYSIP